jgi:ABC-type antimicrobial peptide transport system permease subunit
MALRFLAWFCPPSLYESIEGDLLEQFEEDVQNLDVTRAKRKLLWNVIKFFRPGILLRNKFSTNLIDNFMLFNYFKVASRLIIRNKTYSAITVFGLAFGLSSAILLFLWIHKEFTYDQFHTDKDRIFVAWNRELDKGQINCWLATPRVLAPTLTQEYSAIESAVSYGAYGSKHLFTAGEKRVVKNTGVFVDAPFLTMFSFPLLKGDAPKALANSNSIVLTESFAKQLFGDHEAFGETLTIGEAGYTFPFTITGIIKDLPDNTDFRFDYLLTWGFLESLGEKDTHWGNNSVKTYIKLKEGENIDSFNQTIKDIAKPHLDAGSTVEYFAYPLTKMRLYSHFENGVQSGGRIQIINMLAILGFILLIIACINFVNLSTARAQKRAKEIGIRKVTGALRFSLVKQFLCESILISFGSGIISLLIVYLTLPWFSTLIKQPLSLEFYNPVFWMLWVLFIIVVGVLAGLYPAFYLSSFRPVGILTGTPIIRSNRNTFRQALVVLQFGFAVIMIVSIIVVTRQVNFIQNRQAGYAKDHLVHVPLTGDLNKNNVALKNDLLAAGVAISVSRTSAPITEQWIGTSGMKWMGKDANDKTNMALFIVDNSIVKTAGLVLKEGRDIDLQNYSTDSTAVLLNEAAVKLMGFKQPIGETIVDGDTEYHVVGVVKDFVFLSPHQKIGPMVIEGAAKNAWGFSELYIRLNPNYTSQQSLSAIEKLCLKYNLSYPFEYQFVDEEYQRKFDSLHTSQMISRVFGFTAVFIACLGLLGLSTFMIETRVKEIGIRKVMGSSVINIVRLLSWDILKPIIVAIVVFSPIAFWSIKWWLQTFDYRITLDGWVFAFAGVIILTIALATVIWQAKAAAHENPVKSLRAN